MRRLTLLAVVALLCVTACGGGSSSAPPGLTSITVSPANPSVQVGATQQLSATGTYSDGSTADLTGSVAWTTSAPSYATVDANTGLVHAIAVGSTTITATSRSVSGHTTLNVVPAAGPPPTYSIAATVNGLSSTGLVLQLNSGNNLAIGTNGAATFGAALASGAAYAVTVSTQPGGETCTVTNGSGTVGSANVTTPTVNCTPNSTPQYTVTVNVSGFASGPTLVLQLNGISQLAITGNGSASFSTLLGTGENYVVTVRTQPAPPPTQTCAIASGSGTIGTTNITNVNITCVTTFSVGVSVDGLAGSGLVVQLNGVDDLAVPVNNNGASPGTGTFSMGLVTGATYTVTVKTQPTTPTQTCMVSNGSGTIGTANVTLNLVCPLIYVVSTKGEWTSMSLSPARSTTGGCPPAPVGSPSPVAYHPSGRGNAVSWTDTSGNLWLFGGVGWLPPPASDQTGNVNDLWKYAPSTGTWTCVGGDGSASFGTKGVASPSNLPPGGPGASWLDTAGGKLWLFGDGYNALWRYNLGSGIWTWVSGSSTPDASGVYGAQGTPAPTNIPGARYGSASWIDHAGNLWLFGGSANNDLWEYSPSTGLWVWVAGSVAGTQGAGPKGVYGTKGIGSSSNIPGGRGAAVTWIDSAGNLWLFGGDGIDSKGTSGRLNDLWKYTPSPTFGALGTWTWVGGSDTANAVGVYGTKGGASNTNIPGSRQGAAAWTDLSGDFWLFGGWGCATACGNSVLYPLGELNDFWKYSPATGTWAWMSGSNTPVGATGGQAGTPGVPAPGNTPGGRYSSFSWTDPSGNLWLFGGAFNGIQVEYLNELWVYTPQ